MNLAAARYRCATHALLSGEIVDSDAQHGATTLKGTFHVVIVGRFQMRR